MSLLTLAVVVLFLAGALYRERRKPTMQPPRTERRPRREPQPADEDLVTSHRWM